VLELGAGRARAADSIDFAVGCDEIAKTGREVVFGETLLRIHARSQSAAEQAAHTIRSGIQIE
jgi:thymidine phosphorylase